MEFKPPTDNLFKFMAIAGLALVVLAVTLYLKADYELNAKIFENERTGSEFNIHYFNLSIPTIGADELETFLAQNDAKESCKYCNAMEAHNKAARDEVIDDLDKIAQQLRGLSEPHSPEFILKKYHNPDEKAKIMAALDLKTDDAFEKALAKIPRQALADASRQQAEDAKKLSGELAAVRSHITEMWYYVDLQSLAHLWSWLLGGFGFVLAAAGFWFWVRYVPIPQNRIVANEALKAHLDRGQFIHTLQFETEFNAYRSLWRRVVRASVAAKALLSELTSTTGSACEKQAMARFVEGLNAYTAFYQRVKPFIAADVYARANELADIIEKEPLLASLHRAGVLQQTEESLRAGAERIYKQSELVCAAIRGHISPAQDHARSSQPAAGPLGR